MKLRHFVALVLFFGVWTIVDLPFFVAKKLGAHVHEIGERAA